MKKRTVLLTIAAALALSAALITAGFNPAEALSAEFAQISQQAKDTLAYVLIAVTYAPLFICAIVAVWHGCKGGDHE